MNFQPGPLNIRWAGDVVSASTGRQRARRLFPSRTCEIGGCEKKAERHHKDGNTSNNNAENIAFLCNKHHKEADGRMHRPEFRAACNRKGTTLTAEHRAKIAAANIGKRRSLATRAKLSANKTAFYRTHPRPTHCPRGHVYDVSNTLVRQNGRRECRTCGRLRAMAYYNKKWSSA